MESRLSELLQKRHNELMSAPHSEWSNREALWARAIDSYNMQKRILEKYLNGQGRMIGDRPAYYNARRTFFKIVNGWVTGEEKKRYEKLAKSSEKFYRELVATQFI